MVFMRVQALMGVGSPVGLLFKSRNLKTEGLPMNEIDAILKAENLINLLITHQPQLFGQRETVLDESAGKKLAQGVAALRAELIAQLTQQQ